MSRGFPSLNEQSLRAESRRFWARRYLAERRALGCLPPTRAELERIELLGPPEWWTPPPSAGSGTVVPLLWGSQRRAG